MANDRQWDGLEFKDLDFPYHKLRRELSSEPRLIGGHDTYVTYGGKIIKRPGTTIIDSVANTTLSGKRIDRIWVYETLDSTPYIYLVASVWTFSTGLWTLYYIRLDGPGTPSWTSAGTLRQLNASTAPHEAIVSRGLLYVKGFPSSGSGEKLGTVVFDGTGGTVSTTYWGLLGPTTPTRISGTLHKLSADITNSATSVGVDSVASWPAAPFNIQVDYEIMTVTAVGGTTLTVLRGAQGTVAAAHSANAIAIYRNWTASAHPVTVNMFWAYTYAYKTKTGHITNRAPLETNPDNLPSLTGPFINLIPKITVQGVADTTNVPTIVIYRSTDGATGPYMFLEEITNTGAGSITYEDKSRASSSGNADPVQDKDLDTQNLAADLNGNSPPPTVLAPLVTGTDTPAFSTPLASYQGRLWYAIGNVLFYSANEEINTGIPEESWPAGLYGNFFRFQYPIVGMEGTSDSLYVVTTQSVYEVTGSTKETFNVRLILNNVGGASGHPRAITKYGDALVWLTSDLRIAILQGNNFRTISEPLGSDYVDCINNGAQIDIKYWADMENEWLVVTAIDQVLQARTKVWVYDIKKSSDKQIDFWNTPWTIPTSAVFSGRCRETEQQRRLVFAPWTGNLGSIYLSRLTTRNDLNLTTGVINYYGTDAIPGNNSTPFSCQLQTNLFTVLPGDHVNALRVPGLIPVVYSIYLERTAYSGDTDPTTYYYLNDLWTTPIATRPAYPPSRDDQPKGYKTLIYPVNEKARRIAVEIDTSSNADLFELQNFSVIWDSDSGSGI